MALIVNAIDAFFNRNTALLKTSNLLYTYKRHTFYCFFSINFTVEAFEFVCKVDNIYREQSEKNHFGHVSINFLITLKDERFCGFCKPDWLFLLDPSPIIGNACQ